ncbi:MAG TPA: glycosyltransferase [Campylobacterales bacterium]|nr:glycosyltransferase [Campylobacterales bacterium]
MTKKTKVVYVGPYAFPNGGAAARRILGNALSLRDAGYEVLISSGQMAEGVEEQKSPVENVYEGFRVISLGERTAEKYPKLLKYLMYFNMGVKTITWLESLEKKPDVVILYSGYSPYLMRLMPWCKKNGVKFIFDAVEWYDPKSFISGLLSPYQWNIELAMRYYSKKTDNVIAISSYLQDHYDAQGCHTLRIPPTIDTKKIEPNLKASQENDTLVVSYTGTPGNKDLFNEYLEAVLRLYEEGENIIFRFAGVTVAQLLLFPALIQRNIKNTLPTVLDCRGITSYEEAIAITKSSDFSLLLRRPERYAHAGFPTKIVESLTMGTPVIINVTSDLGDYVHEGIEGLICNDHSIDALIASLKKAMTLSSEEKIQMRHRAREQAELSFDCFKYSQVWKEFIQSNK